MRLPPAPHAPRLEHETVSIVDWLLPAGTGGGAALQVVPLSESRRAIWLLLLVLFWYEPPTAQVETERQDTAKRLAFEAVVFASAGCGASADDTAPVPLTVTARGRSLPEVSRNPPTAMQPSSAHDTACNAPWWLDPVPALLGSETSVGVKVPPAKRSRSPVSRFPVAAYCPAASQMPAEHDTLKSWESRLAPVSASGGTGASWAVQAPPAPACDRTSGWVPPLDDS